MQLSVTMFALQIVKWGVNSGFTPIVIVIRCHFLTLFFHTKWHPNFRLFRYNYIKRGDALPSSCLRRAFVVPSLLRWRQGVSKTGWKSPHHDLSYPFSGWTLFVFKKGELKATAPYVVRSRNKQVMGAKSFYPSLMSLFKRPISWRFCQMVTIIIVSSSTK